MAGWNRYNFLQLFLASSLLLISVECRCYYNCGTKNEIPFPKEGHVPVSNGCGSYGFSFKHEDFDFEPCCDVHDECFDYCNKSKWRCDEAFKTCLMDVCDRAVGTAKQREECRTSAEMMHQMSANFGCPAFLSSQELACECRSPTDEEREEFRAERRKQRKEETSSRKRAKKPKKGPKRRTRKSKV
mmetsp:Transcript_61670/g.70728  ORF Transcript_61670/g.70728 Transcript_61670/m.70728 type:complete len:186 (+) Transcript_61670:135-692(+)